MSTIAERDHLPGVMASAAAGDEVAFARIVAAHHDDMVRVAYLVTCEVDLANDAVQSAWPIAWRKLVEPPRSRSASVPGWCRSRRTRHDSCCASDVDAR